MPDLGWCAAVVLALIVGFACGNINGKAVERASIANECKRAGAFVNKRTGFECGVIR